MSSPSKPSFYEFSASQPIAFLTPCSECALPSEAICPACDDSLCLAHLYLCDDCDTPLCASCVADHRADVHWSDSATAAELHTPLGLHSRRLRIDDPRHAQAPHHFHPTDTDVNHHSHFPVHCDRIGSEALPHADSPEPSPLPYPNSEQTPEAPPVHAFPAPTDSSHRNAPVPQELTSQPGLVTCSADSNASVLLQRLLSHIQTQAESRHLALPSLHACVYIQIFCVRCGYMRQALSELPQDQTTSCPGCARPRPFAALAIGFTSRALPFHERFFLTGHAPHQLPWDRLRSPNSERPRRRRPPTRSVDSETRDFLHRHLERFRQIADSMLRPDLKPRSRSSRNSAP